MPICNRLILLSSCLLTNQQQLFVPRLAYESPFSSELA